MRILHIPHAYHPVIGGAELICKKVSESLVERGHEVHVLTTDVGAVQAYYEFGVTRVSDGDAIIAGVSVRRLKFSSGLYCAGGWASANMRPRGLAKRVAGRTLQFLNKRLDRQISKEIRRIRPDVVMTMPHLVVNVQAVLSARAHDDFPLVMVPMLHEHAPQWHSAAMAKALSHADATIALTSHEADRLVEAYGVPRRKSFMASVGIDIDSHPVSEFNRPQCVIYLGRQVKSKGIGDLIDAMCLVWPECQDAQLIVAGVRLPESAEVDARISEIPSQWRSRVRTFGAVSDVEKANLLRSSRCLVLPSKTESFGMVILEAWAQGTAAITWDLPIFRSIIDDGKSGLLVNTNEGPKGLANAIKRLLVMPGEAARMGMAGYEMAKDVYSWEKVTSVYLDAYNYAVSQHNQVRGLR